MEKTGAGALLSKAGLNVPILSGGSTGTYNIDSAIRGITELQVGSYVFMDVDYRRIGGRNDQPVYSDFQPSLTVLATVVSATDADRVTRGRGRSAGHHGPSRAQARGWEGLSDRPAGDEFGVLTAEKGAACRAWASALELVVPHCDPTTNLYDRIYAIRGEKVEAVWPIVARREVPS